MFYCDGDKSMSNLNFLHSGGNKVIISAPDSNPSSDVTLKLPQSDGSNGQFLKTNGSGALSFASVTETITSGTYTSLGTGTHLDLSTGNSTNVIKYELMFRSVSTNGSNDWQFQLGDAGGIETSGYSVVAGYDGSNEGTSSRTDGFRWTGAGSAGFIMDGKFSLTRIHSNIWWGVGDLVRTEGGSTLYYFKGSKELSAAITQIRIMASSNLSTNFDGGYVKLITYNGSV